MCGFDPFQAVGNFFADIDPGPAIGDALADIDPGPAIGGALAGLDDLVGDIVPGGWGTIAKIALTSAGVPAPVANGLVTVAEGVHRGLSPEQALLNGVKSGAITYGLGELQNLVGNIDAVGVDNVISDWEFAANNGSFADAGAYFTDNYVAPAIGGSFDAYGDGGSMSFDELVGLTGISDADVSSIPSDANFAKYIERYPDLAAAGIDTAAEALRHYLDYGRNEGRDISSSGAMPQPSSESYSASPQSFASSSSQEYNFTPFYDDLSSKISGVQNYLSGRITNVRDDLTGQIIGVRDNLTGQISGVRNELGDFRTETRKVEENRKRQEEGKEAVDLLSQMASGSVKSSIPAEIDYLYDISGESIFATPKQESLFGSPFEEAPEAVQGAAPRYQYYDPKGGYMYAGGGMVAFDEGGDVTQEELEAALRPATYNSRIAASGETSRRRKEEALARQEQGPEDTVVDEYGNVIRFSDYGKAPPTLDESVQQLTGMEPGVERSTFLPYSKEAGVHVPEIIYGGIKSVLSPEQARKYGNVTGREGVETAMNMMGGALGVSSGLRNPTGVERGVDLGMQIGPNAAKYFDKSLAQLAQNALDAGVDPSRLKQMTGTEQFPMYKNMDTKVQAQTTGPWANVGFQEGSSNPFGSRLYQEISDKDAVYASPVYASPNSGFRDMINNLLDFYRIKDMPESTPVKMSDILKHPKLYEAYPEVKDIPVLYYSAAKNEKGYIDPRTGEIGLNKNNSKEKQLDVLLHEIQHAIQKKEGWVDGSSPEMHFLSAAKTLSPAEYNLLHSGKPGADAAYKKLYDEAFKMYQRNQGEASARATPARRHLDDQQIRITPTRYDVPEAEINPYADGGLIEDEYTIDDLYRMLGS